MRCEACKDKVATVKLTEIVGKKKKEVHLCDGCAKQNQAEGALVKSEFSLSDLLGGLVEAEAKERPSEIQRAACPECGMTYSEFRANGRFGCPNDYRVFEKGIVPLLEKIHGASQHTGKVPVRHGKQMAQQKDLQELRRQLEESIVQEDYEKAADFRDKIREIMDDGDGDR